MNPSQSALKILQVFREGKNFVVLREVAKDAGFSSAANREFKDGLNLLIRKSIVKLQQSGWPSEKRGGGTGNHESVILLQANIFDYDNSNEDLPAEKILADYVRDKVQTTFVIHPLSNEMKEKLKSCSDCKGKPVVFITQEQIPVCDVHWERLANSNIEW